MTSPISSSPISSTRKSREGLWVHGATVEHGIRAVEKPVHVHNFHATILHLLGLDHTRLIYHYAGCDYCLTYVHGEVVKEILA